MLYDNCEKKSGVCLITNRSKEHDFSILEASLYMQWEQLVYLGNQRTSNYILFIHLTSI